MNRQIKTKAEYEEAIANLRELMLKNPDENSSKAIELNRLVMSIKSYETNQISEN